MVKIPAKYVAGLTPAEKKRRIKRIIEGMKSNTNDPRAYRPFPTDKGKKTRRSTYTTQFYKKYPGARSLREKAKASGVPYRIIKEVYDRGLAAWRTGHRPGASQQAWGYARVHSFIMKGKTYYTADSDLARKLNRAKSR